MKINWDERFDVPGYVYGTDPNAFVAARAAMIPAGPVPRNPMFQNAME